MSSMNIKHTFNNLCTPVSHTIRGSVFCISLTVLIFTGCATDEIGKMKYDINILKADVKKVKNKSENMEFSLPGQNKQLNEKILKIEESQKATGKSVSDLLFKMQSLTTDFQTLTGQFEETRYFSEKSSTELQESNTLILAKLLELEMTLEELQKSMPAGKIKGSQHEEIDATVKESQSESSIESRTETEKQPSTTLIKNIYLDGYQAYQAGNTSEARDKFSSILNNYPENDYSDNARFWIGESYYKEERYEDSILAYEELFKNNPNSDKVPGAMLKQGLAFYSLKDKKTGKIILEKLIEKHPKSEQAKIAARKIKKTVLPKKSN